MISVLAAGMVGAAWCVSLSAQEKAAEGEGDFPPRVVSVEPADRAKDVDVELKEIRVTFDRAMTTGRNYSWIMLREYGEYPGYMDSPAPRWEEGGKTCVLSVRLRPGTLYAVGVNSFRHTGFRDAAGKPAVPFAWVFRTK
jgi:hypothetical protein